MKFVFIVRKVSYRRLESTVDGFQLSYLLFYFLFQKHGVPST